MGSTLSCDSCARRANLRDSASQTAKVDVDGLSPRAARALGAGKEAAKKLRGETDFVCKSPALPGLPANRYYVVLRTKRGVDALQIFTESGSFQYYLSVVACSCAKKLHCPESRLSTSHAFAAQFEIVEYLRGAGFSSQEIASASVSHVTATGSLLYTSRLRAQASAD